MSESFIVLVVILAVLGAVMFVPLKVAADGQRSDAGARAASGWRWGGVVAGAIAALVVAMTMGLGRGLLLAAPVFGLGVVLGVVFGELRVPRPAGPVRRAAVETRSVGDYLPRRLAAFVGLAGVMGLGLLVWTTSLGSADDMGRAGRALRHTCGELSTAKSPWPGSFYSIPLGATVGIGLLLAAVGLWRVVGRPRPTDGSGELIRDDQARWISATSITGACGFLITVPLIGVSLVAAAALISMPCAAPSWEPIGWTLLLLSGCWFVLLVWCVKAILLPSDQPRASRIAA